MNEFLRSFHYAAKGIFSSFSEQRNLKIQATIAVITIFAGIYFDITVVEWCLIIISIGLVIGLEMINSAIEDLVDLVTTEWKPLAGRVKDIAAGAVLLASVVAVSVGVLIFKDYVPL